MPDRYFGKSGRPRMRSRSLTHPPARLLVSAMPRNVEAGPAPSLRANPGLQNHLRDFRIDSAFV